MVLAIAVTEIAVIYGFYSLFLELILVEKLEGLVQTRNLTLFVECSRMPRQTSNHDALLMSTLVIHCRSLPAATFFPCTVGTIVDEGLPLHSEGMQLQSAQLISTL